MDGDEEARAFVENIFRGRRGPMEGRGATDHPPWAGVVEDAPRIWVTWLVETARRAGRPAPIGLTINDRFVPIVSTRLTYGLRYYFECPRCGRRVECIYFVGARFGCRRCMRLGYRSQTHRRDSPWAILDNIFDRDLYARRWDLDRDAPIDCLVEELRATLRERVARLFEGVQVVGVEEAKAGSQPLDFGGVGW